MKILWMRKLTNGNLQFNLEKKKKRKVILMIQKIEEKLIEIEKKDL